MSRKPMQTMPDPFASLSRESYRGTTSPVRGDPVVIKTKEGDGIRRSAIEGAIKAGLIKSQADLHTPAKRGAQPMLAKNPVYLHALGHHHSHDGLDWAGDPALDPRDQNARMAQQKRAAAGQEIDRAFDEGLDASTLNYDETDTDGTEA